MENLGNEENREHCIRDRDHGLDVGRLFLDTGFTAVYVLVGGRGEEMKWVTLGRGRRGGGECHQE